MRKHLLLAAVASMGLSLFCSCGNNDTLNLKDAKIEGDLAEYISFSKETATVEFTRESYLDVDDEHQYGIGDSFITINLPVKIIKKIENDHLHIEGKVIAEGSTYSLYSPTFGSEGRFSSEEQEEYEKFLESPVGTEGIIKLRMVTRLGNFADHMEKEDAYAEMVKDRICDSGNLTLREF